MPPTTIASRTPTEMEKLVRKAGYRPISANFDPQRLRQALAELEAPTDRDREIVEFAIWTAASIATINEKRVAHRFQAIHPVNRLEILLTLVNAEIWKYNRNSKREAQEAGFGHRRVSLDTHQRMRTGLKLRSAEATESVIQAFSYVVADALNDIARLGNTEPVVEEIADLKTNEVIEYVNFGTSYRVHLEMWQRVATMGFEAHRHFRDWQLSQDPARAKRAAVGEIRKYRQADSELQQMLERWKAKPKLPPVIEGVAMPTMMGVRFHQDSATWSFDTVPCSDDNEDHRILAARVHAAMYSWTRDLAEIGFDADGTTTSNIFSTWLVLRSLAEQWMDESVEGSGHPPLTPFILATTDVHRLITQGLGCTESEAETWLGYLVNDGGLLTELYSNPVIPMADGAIALFVPGLLNADFGRVVDQWLKRHLEKKTPGSNSIKYGDKGAVFERFIRSVLSDAARTPALPGWVVEPDPIVFQKNAARNGREFDLIVRFGRTLIIGEAKCSAHPADPNELNDREKLISDGVKQVREEVQWIKDNWDEFRSRLSPPLEGPVETYRIIPVVVLDGCWGPGFAVDGVSVIDGADLKTYILQNQWFAGIHEGKRVGVMTLYRTAADAETMLPAYLEQPPIVARYLNECGPRELKYKKIGPSGGKLTYRDLVMRARPGLDGLEDEVRKIASDLQNRAREGAAK